MLVCVSVCDPLHRILSCCPNYWQQSQQRASPRFSHPRPRTLLPLPLPFSLLLNPLHHLAEKLKSMARPTTAAAEANTEHAARVQRSAHPRPPFSSRRCDVASSLRRRRGGCGSQRAHVAARGAPPQLARGCKARTTPPPAHVPLSFPLTPSEAGTQRQNRTHASKPVCLALSPPSPVLPSARVCVCACLHHASKSLHPPKKNRRDPPPPLHITCYSEHTGFTATRALLHLFPSPV